MTVLGLTAVFIGGGLGSLCRYLLGNAIMRLHPGGFPAGTFIINIMGGFCMGAWISWMALHGAERAREWHLLIAVGVLGGFTTFSTFTLDAYTLYERGQVMLCAAYILGSVALALLGLVLGLWLMRTLS